MWNGCQLSGSFLQPYLLVNIRSGYLDAGMIPPHLTINQSGSGREHQMKSASEGGCGKLKI